jgi:alanyl-tRNA synthetase
MRANELRKAFTEYFVARGHVEVPSASLIPHDPTVLFTIAGMVPFKPYFTGDEVAPFPRATSVQRCIRTSDIDIIGTTQRHGTFFEMLGNFSFGDYFKPEAITMAWGLLTEVMGLDPERLWVTVHDSDEDATDLWIDRVGVRPERIQRMGEDNFWRMGDVGPCGPCSEIYVDKGPSYGADGGPAFGGEDRFVEIWNLVFMQYFRQATGELLELPRKNIDTGSGLERVLAILQNKESIFDTDLFAPIMDVAQSLTGVRVGASEREDISLRILADHGRAMTMLVGDGVTPSNEGRGYVLRRLIRRSMLAARRAGTEAPIVEHLARVTAETMAEAHPTLLRELDRITGVLVREEEGFNRTIRSGLSLLHDDHAALDADAKLPGVAAFKLHDTHGFPIELTVELAAEAGVSVDVEGFEVEMTAQRERARAATRQPRQADEAAYRELLQHEGQTAFVGRTADRYRTGARVIAILGDPTAESCELFLDQTPFYAEGGGQVGDTGTISTDTGIATVLDTVSVLPGLTAHRVRIEGTIDVGQEAMAEIDGDRRDAIRRNHTATHLLHAALRSVLGDHVRQQGSLVEPDRLRFDFTHDGPLTEDQLNQVLAIVNGDVLGDGGVETVDATKAEAEQMGAVAFFGDKYGDRVRVVRAGVHSLEFCGGTHVDRLGTIGTISVLSEASIGAGVRRVEATTGFVSIARAREAEATIREAAALLKAEPDQLSAAITRQLERAKALEQQLQSLKRSQIDQLAASLAAEANSGSVVTQVDGFAGDEVRSLVQALRNNGVGVAIVASAGADGKVAVGVASDGRLDAGATCKALAPLVGGGGGGAKDLAVAGGRDASGIPALLAKARELVEA